MTFALASTTNSRNDAAVIYNISKINRREPEDFLPLESVVAGSSVSLIGGGIVPVLVALFQLMSPSMSGPNDLAITIEFKLVVSWVTVSRGLPVSLFNWRITEFLLITADSALISSELKSE